MKSSNDGEHYLLLRTALWSDAFDVVGIYGSEQRARAAAGTSPGPDRWVLEKWSGDERCNSVQLEADTHLR